MKLAVAIASSDAPSDAFVVWRGFEESIKKAAALGFHSVELALKEAAKHDVIVIIEPVNRYEINFVNSLDEGAELLAKVERPNLGLMPDVFTCLKKHGWDKWLCIEEWGNQGLPGIDKAVEYTRQTWEEA